MRKIVLLVSFVVVTMLIAAVLLYENSQFEQGLPQPEFEATLPVSTGEKTKEDCGCQEKKNGYSGEKHEIVGELQLVKIDAQKT